MNPVRRAAGWAEVRITGAEPIRMLDALAAAGIPFWDAEPPRDFCLVFRMGTRHLKRLDALAAGAGCEAEVLRVRGFPALLRGRRLSLWLMLGSAALILCLSLSRVWFITVEDNENIPTGVILNALEECGVRPGADWTAFSQDQIRNSMMLRLPGLRWLTVTMQGCRARVILRERTERIVPENEKEYARITADRAGLVTAVRAMRGTAETEAGRMLLPGDTVVGGYATGRFGVQGPVRAVGYAEARTWYELVMEAPAACLEKEAAGESRTLWSLVFGKKRVNFFKDSSICPADCDKIIETWSLELPGVFRLPVFLEKTVIAPYTLAERETDRREELEPALTEELRRLIGEEGEIVSSSFTCSGAGGLFFGTLRAECREKIGVTVPLTEEEIREIRSKIPQTEE